MLAFKISRELSEVGPEVMAVFGITDFLRDYEDTWEWVEGCRNDGVKVNVSRPHDWNQGRYEMAVIVHVKAKARLLAEPFYETMAQALADRLKTEVWRGYTEGLEDPKKYSFIVDERYYPNQTD